MARLVGGWRIAEMDLWDRDAIDLLGPAFIEFTAEGTGRFRFIAVGGNLDFRHDERATGARVEFTWEGNDEMDEASGDGWAEVQKDRSLNGEIRFHNGDDSTFKAHRW